MSEEVTERTDLIASISSQVAEGVGPLINQIVEKRFKEEKGAKTSSIHVPTLSHPGLNAQASLLSKWISDIDEIEATQEPEERKEKIGALKKNLKRRLTTVVGADSDAAIFQLADAYEKVETAIDQSDDFGRAVAEHLKRAATAKS
ncbi:hypothetical protein Y032_0522g2897 [Ancylostoma ceylanicum]|nr:hypothetical protein Y032_0522g2897 [Ancylostoma ceylanicum]